MPSALSSTRGRYAVPQFYNSMLDLTLYFVHQAKDQTAWATALALAALEAWFKAVEDEWQLIAARAYHFIDGLNARALITAAASFIHVHGTKP